MDGKTKTFFAIFFLLLVGSVGMTYYRMFVSHDYLVRAETSCDPELETCFVRTCEPDNEACEADSSVEDDTVLDEQSAQEGGVGSHDEAEEKNAVYYKIVTKKAVGLPSCAPGNGECPEVTCTTDEHGCQETLCSVETVPDNEQCNDPELYRKRNGLDTEPAVDSGEL